MDVQGIHLALLLVLPCLEPVDVASVVLLTTLSDLLRGGKFIEISTNPYLESAPLPGSGLALLGDIDIILLIVLRDNVVQKLEKVFQLSQFPVLLFVEIS